MPSVIQTSNEITMNVPVKITGNVGIGTLTPQSPLDVMGLPIIMENASYASISYVDYTSLSAFTNRISVNMNISYNNETHGLLPDFGFDFFINNTNVRSSTYVSDKGYFTFGSDIQHNWAYIYELGFSLGYHGNTPRLFIATGANTSTSLPGLYLSYYAGLYNGLEAMYVFYSGFISGQTFIWCVVFTSDNKITILLQFIGSGLALGQITFTYGIYTGKYWIPLPINNTMDSRNQVAYQISPNNGTGSAVQVHGDSVFQGKSYFTGNVGIGVTPSSFALEVQGSLSASYLYGNGAYLTNVGQWTTDPNASVISYVGAVGIGTTIVENNNCLRVDLGNAIIMGNVGVGTTIAEYPLQVIGPAVIMGNVGGETPITEYSLQVIGPAVIVPLSTTIAYTDYTQWTEYANRTNISFSFNSDDGYGILPDFGFDFFINGQNYRSTTYACTNSFIAFGAGFRYIDPPSMFDVPALFIGSGDTVVYSISYYLGTYNGNSAIYIFFDGHEYEVPENQNQWCAILQPNTKVTILMTQIEYSSGNMPYGLWGGSGNGWIVELPENNTSIPRYNVAHEISFTSMKGTSIYADGRLYTSDKVGVGTSSSVQTLDVNGGVYISGNVGIGTTTPATALVVNGTIRNINGPAPNSGTSLVITGNGDIAPQSSDARYKTNVEDLPFVLDKLMDIRTVSYNWKDEPQKWYGLLAQQVSDVFPEVAWHNESDDTFGVHYTPSVVTLLLKALQEMKTTYDQRLTLLQQEIESLKSLNA